MFKFQGIKPDFKNLIRIVKNCRFKSNAEDYEILNHLIDKRTNVSKIYVPESKYGGESVISIIYDKSGVQAIDYIQNLFTKLQIPLAIEQINVDDEFYETKNSVLSVLRNKYAINLDIVHSSEKKTQHIQMHNDLDLYAAIIRLFTMGRSKEKAKNVDTVMIIQNSVGDNTKLEYEPVDGLVETLKVTEEKTLLKVVSYAFKYANRNRRRKITFVHKVPYFPQSDSILINLGELIGKNYPHIKIEKMDVDVASREMVLKPQNFDVVCTNDRYGTLLTSIMCGVCGGPETFCCSNVGTKHAIFQPLQNKLSVPMESNTLSPYGISMAIINLLAHINYAKCSHAIWKAFLKTTFVDNVRTKLFDGDQTGTVVGCKIVENLDEYKCYRSF